jgi:hypothetical protein
MRFVIATTYLPTATEVLLKIRPVLGHLLELPYHPPQLRLALHLLQQRRYGKLDRCTFRL